MSINYTDLVPTTSGDVCLNCREYKSVMDCPDEECGASICIYCMDGCEGCGEEIAY